jgi:hypothetical protein
MKQRILGGIAFAEGWPVRGDPPAPQREAVVGTAHLLEVTLPCPVQQAPATALTQGALGARGMLEYIG